MTTHSDFFARLRERLSRSRAGLVSGIRRVFTSRSRIDDEIFDDLEEVLIQADMGVETTMAIVEEMRVRAREDKLEDPKALLAILRDRLVHTLEQGDHTLTWDGGNSTHVTLIAGVNGAGKTTTIGKLAAHLKSEGKSVLLGAADTFRAAAVDQLTAWSEKVDVPIVKHQQEGADPASVAFDAADAALARGIECLIIDTAGRLHTKVNLMEEIGKIRRVLDKRIPGAPHEVLLVLDATTGQNGLQQARRFTEVLDVTGIVLTKLDGTAKGGIAVAVQQELGIPIKLIGVGESVDDLLPFNAEEFVDALLDIEESD